VPSEPDPAVAPPEPEPTARGTESDANDALDAVLAGLNWSHLLRRRRGWSWDPAQRGLLNADRLLLRFIGVEWMRHRAKLRFMSIDRQRQATLAVPASLARAIDAAMGHETTVTSEAGSTWLIAPATVEERYSIGWPWLVRAAARQAPGELAANTEIWVRVRSSSRRTAHPLLEPLRARRQHRRLTWDERLARHAARSRASVRVWASSNELANWLQSPPTDVQPARPTM
jgi:hypothetical protein